MSRNNPHNEAHNDPPDAGRGYERRDAHLHVVLYLAAAVAILVVVSGFGLYWFADSDPSDAGRRDTVKSPTDHLPPVPHLQHSPIKDYEAFLAEQDAELASYGWIDREHGTVRIPIDRAKELVLERGLPKPMPPEEKP